MPIIFDINRQQCGLYNHYNDKYMINPAHPYTPPPPFNPASGEAPQPRGRRRTQAADTPAASFPAQPTAPEIYVVERHSDPWLYYYFGKMMGTFSSPIHYAPVTRHVSSEFRPANEKNKKEEQKPSLLGAAVFFGAAITVAGVGIAYSLKEVRTIAENLWAKRKKVVTSIRLASGSFLGFVGWRAGSILGAYYGPALFGETLGTVATAALVGGGLGGALLASAGAAGGFLAGKYFAKACVYVYTRGKSTNSDPHSLAPAVERNLAKQFLQPSAYIESRPNLMLCYLLNKIEVAKKNGASADWQETLKGFVKDLKAGNLTEQLKAYFDNEFATVRYDWFMAKQQAGDPRYANEKITEIERDFVALAIMTSKEAQLHADFAYFSPMQAQVLFSAELPRSGTDRLYPDLGAVYGQPAPSAPPVEVSSVFQPSYQARQAGSAVMPESAKINPEGKSTLGLH